MLTKSVIYLAVITSLSLIAFSTLATPAGVHVKSVKKLNKPGLILVNFTVVWSNGIAGENIITNKFVDYAYRVYCPTAMVRDVTKGRWGKAHLGLNDHSIGAGVFNEVIYQVCPEQHDKIIKLRTN